MIKTKIQSEEITNTLRNNFKNKYNLNDVQLDNVYNQISHVHRGSLVLKMISKRTLKRVYAKLHSS